MRSETNRCKIERSADERTAKDRCGQKKSSHKNLRGRIRSTAEEKDAFNKLQRLFVKPTTLHLFNQTHQLYIDVDASKEYGTRVVCYHSKNETKIGQVLIEPILFLSRMLTDAETRYWLREIN